MVLKNCGSASGPINCNDPALSVAASGPMPRGRTSLGDRGRPFRAGGGGSSTDMGPIECTMVGDRALDPVKWEGTAQALSAAVPAVRPATVRQLRRTVHRIAYLRWPTGTDGAAAVGEGTGRHDGGNVEASGDNCRITRLGMPGLRKSNGSLEEGIHSTKCHCKKSAGVQR